METGHGIKYRQLHIEDYLRNREGKQECTPMKGLPGTPTPTRTLTR